MCDGCGDSEKPVAVQAGQVVVCDTCLARIASLVLVGEPKVVEALFGCIPAPTHGEVTSAQAHFDLAIAYESKGLAGDALTELALAATVDGEPDSEAWARLLEPLVARGTLASAAREGQRRAAIAN